MNLRTQGSYILTGGTGSLAASIAEVFADSGARLVLVGRNDRILKDRSQKVGALGIVADLTRSDEAERVVQESLKSLGRVDGLIHTVGGFAMGSAQATGPEIFDQMIDVNLRTLFNAVRAVLPPLLAQGSGFIAGISSGIVRSGGGAGMTAYIASKGGVSAYLSAVEAEVGPQGIRVAVVHPQGAIDTQQNRVAMPETDPSGWVDPKEIAQALLFAATRGPRGTLAEITLRARL